MVQNGTIDPLTKIHVFRHRITPVVAEERLVDASGQGDPLAQAHL